MPGITAYARIAGLALLVAAALGARDWGWGDASILYYAGAGLFFLLVGFSRLGSTSVREIVGGLGVLVALVNGVAVLASWLLLPVEYLHGPVEIGSLALGAASILAARYLPDEGSRRHGRQTY